MPLAMLGTPIIQAAISSVCSKDAWQLCYKEHLRHVLSLKMKTTAEPSDL